MRVYNNPQQDLYMSPIAASSSGPSSPPTKQYYVDKEKPPICIENFFKERQWTTVRFEMLTLTGALATRRFHNAFDRWLIYSVFRDTSLCANITQKVHEIKIGRAHV